jgi:YidC/Oxa1 family membrane protein insertase
MEEEKRNVIIFFAISILIVLCYPYFFDNQSNRQSALNVSDIANTNSEAEKHIFVKKKNNAAVVTREKPQNINLDSENLSGIISTLGLKIDNVFLKKYSEKLGSSEKVSILGDGEYYALVGWVSNDNNVALPDETTVWKTNSTKLTQNTPVTLSWDNKNGLAFERTISVDKNFVITIVDMVRNYGTNSCSLSSFAKIRRGFVKNITGDTWTSYEGPIGYINDKFEEISYEDIAKNGEIKNQTRNGWFGITDKYWLVAFIPNQHINANLSYKHYMESDKNVYEINSDEETIHLSPSSEVTRVYNLFVGAKEIKTLDMYEEKLGIKHFDLAIDFGYLYVLTKPLLYSLAFIKDIVGNMGIGIILLTLLIKLLLFPLANKSYRSMNRMKNIQPKIQALQKKYESDKVKLGQEISALYQKEGINPIGGCLPTLLQSPVLFALYKVLYISIEIRHAPFILWIHDLSSPDPLAVLNLFGLIPIDLPDFLKIGIWPVLMGLSMLIQQKMTPSTGDDVQAKMMMMMPIMFTFMFAQLPSGLVIYWTFSNVLSMMQQYYLMKHEEKSKDSNKSK